MTEVTRAVLGVIVVKERVIVTKTVTAWQDWSAAPTTAKEIPTRVLMTVVNHQVRHNSVSGNTTVSCVLESTYSKYM